MKKYQATVRLTHYVTVEVEAQNEALAVDKALEQAWEDVSKGRGKWDDEPQITELMTVVEEKA